MTFVEKDDPKGISPAPDIPRAPRRAMPACASACGRWKAAIRQIGSEHKPFRRSPMLERLQALPNAQVLYRNGTTEAAALVVQILPILLLGLLAKARSVLVGGRRDDFTYFVGDLILLAIEMFVTLMAAMLTMISRVSLPADCQLFGVGPRALSSRLRSACSLSVPWPGRSWWFAAKAKKVARWPRPTTTPRRRSARRVDPEGTLWLAKAEPTSLRQGGGCHALSTGGTGLPVYCTW